MTVMQLQNVDDAARGGRPQSFTAPMPASMPPERCELVVDLLNYDALRGELVESLDRCRRELHRENEILGRMEERYRVAARARDAFIMNAERMSGAAMPDREEVRHRLSYLSAEASLACLELNTYRNQVHHLRERIALIEDRLAEIDREIAGRRRILQRVAGGRGGAQTFPGSLA